MCLFDWCQAKAFELNLKANATALSRLLTETGVFVKPVQISLGLYNRPWWLLLQHPTLSPLKWLQSSTTSATTLYTNWSLCETPGTSRSSKAAQPGSLVPQQTPPFSELCAPKVVFLPRFSEGSMREFFHFTHVNELVLALCGGRS